MASDAAGNVVQFRVTRYVQSLESDAVDASARLEAVTDPQSYEDKQLERDVAALEVEVSEAEAELEAALAEERGDLRGETEAEVRAIEVETDAIKARLERPFRKKD